MIGAIYYVKHGIVNRLKGGELRKLLSERG
jgi:hypothetical protein